MKLFFTTLLALFCYTMSVAQVLIYEETFADDLNGATSGSGWSGSGSDCDMTSGSRFGVFSGRFEWRDIEGTCGCSMGSDAGGQTDNVFEVGPIDIEGCSVTASITVGGVITSTDGTFECNGSTSPNYTCLMGYDQLAVEYSIDGGNYQLFTDGFICGSTASDGKNFSVPLTVTGITGSTISIRVTGGNKAIDEIYFIDNIRIRSTGSAAVVDIMGDNSVCAGGTGTLNATAGFARYRWNTGDTTESITITTPRTYSVTATTAAGCTATKSVTITQAPAPTVAITSISPQVCSGGTLTLSTNSVFNSYEWSTGETTRDITIDTSGTYRVTVTDAAGCRGMTSRTIGLAPKPNVTINSNADAFCTGGNVQLRATAGLAGYRWSSGETTPNINVSREGTYTVTVTNAAGCTNEASKDITENKRPQLDPVTPQSACGNFTLPEIKGINLTGSEAYYESTNGMGRTFSPGEEISNSQTLYIYDGITGCSDQKSYVVTIRPKPNIALIPNQAVCNSYTLPRIAGTNLTGNEAYFTNPNGAGTKLNIGQTITTSQTIYMYDGIATCFDDKQFSISVTPSPRLNDLRDTSVCSAYALPPITGINLTANRGYFTGINGTGTRLNSGQSITTSQIIYIYDTFMSCPDQQSVNITIAPGPNITKLPDQTACVSYTLPAITGTGITANAAYFTGANGTGTRLLPNQTVNTSQTLFVYDINGTCKDEETLKITIASTPVVNDIPDTTSCSFIKLPSITGTNLSANAAYFTQTNGAGTRYSIGDTIRNTLNLFIYDGAPGCNDQEQVTFNVLLTPNVTPIPNATACANYILPKINGTNLSGNEAYFTQPAGGDTRYRAGDTIRTTSTLYLFDRNAACSDGEVFIVNILPSPTLAVIADTTSCKPFVLRTIQGTNLSANAAYFTQTNGAGTRYQAGDTIKTTTNLFAFDTNGTCPANEPFRVNIAPSLTANITGRNPTCNSASTGALEVTVLGSSPFRFDWNQDLLDGQQNVMNVAAGNYSVTVTDINNCVTVATTALTEPTALNLQCTPQDPASALNAADGRASIRMGGGTAPYLLTWTGTTPGARTVATADSTLLTGLRSGSYELTLRDANGCTTTCNFAISVRGCDIQLDIIGNDPTCTNTQDGSIQVTLTGARLPLQYNWNVDSLDTKEDPTGLGNGNYSLNVTDANNCLVSASIQLNAQATPPEATITFDNVICEGECFNFNIALRGTPPFFIDYQIITPLGPIAQTYQVRTLNDDLRICPADLGVTSGVIPIAFLQVRDSVCQNNLNLRDTLTVLPLRRDTIRQTLCESDSIVVNGTVYNQRKSSGIEMFPDAATNGCDSIIVINLQFFPPATATLNRTICESDSLVVNGTIYNRNKPNGTEVLRGASANGCDSIVNISLQFFPTANSTLNRTICESDSLVVNGNIYNRNKPSGTEIVRGASANGCDSIVNISLQFFPAATSTLNRTICQGDSLVVNGNIYNRNKPNGTEILRGASTNGCDSIVTINLQFTPPPTSTLNRTICESDSLIVNGTIYNRNKPSGTEVLRGASANGCDSIVNISLQFFPTASFTLNRTICESDSLVVNGTIYNRNKPSGTEVLRGASANGCDSIVNISLQFFPTASFTLNRTICESDSVVVNGNVYNRAKPSGAEIVRGVSANGCDSIVNISLQFFPTASFTLNRTICESDSLVVNGNLYNRTKPSGTEILRGAAINGCDSTINISLQFTPFVTNNLNPTLCANDSLVVNGKTYNLNTPRGTETIRGGSASGCDSIVNVNLQFFPAALTTINSTLCEGDTLRVNGKLYNQINPTGTEIVRGGSANGCDSTINIRLQFLQAVRVRLDTTLCAGDTLRVSGKSYTVNNTSGTGIIENGAVNGCDSIIEVTVRFVQPTVFDLNDTICESDSLMVNGTVYNRARPNGTETFQRTGTSGCDSVVNVRLQFLPAITRNLDAVICQGDSIRINGTIYNAANPTGREILQSRSGCDSIVNVTVRFLPTPTFNLTQTICENDTLVVNGTIYGRSRPTGTETLRRASAAGCDSIITIRLNFFPRASFDLNQTLCTGDSLVVNGKVYNQNNPRGMETLRDASRTGCDSIVNVNLTFRPSVRVTLDTTLCPTDSLIVNRTIYNALKSSGVEVIRGGSVNGCDSIINVNLRFRPAVRGALEGSTTICTGDSATLTFRLSGAPTFDVRYSNGSGTPIQLNGIADGHTIRVKPSTTTIYIITTITVNGASCPAQIGSAATVRVSNLIVNAVLASNFTNFGVSCKGATDGKIRVESTSGIAPFTYRWSTGATEPELQNVGAGTYFVTITDAAGCAGTDSVTVTEPTPIVANTSTKSPGCKNDKTGVLQIDSIGGGAAPYEVSLDGKSYRSVSGLPFQLTGLTAGNYTVFVRDANDCENQLSVSIAAPSAPQLSLGEDVTVKLGDSVQLTGLANFIPTKIQWNPTTFLSEINSLQTFVKPTETTTYDLIISDTTGCKASDQITVFLNRARGVYISNAFTPDGDGINDIFHINGGNDVKQIKELRVYDRWGNLHFQRSAFQPNDPQFGWDGTFNGTKVNIGVYVYYAEIEFVDGFVEVFTGDVTVAR